MKKFFLIAIAIMMFIPTVGMAADMSQAQAQAEARAMGVKGLRLAEMQAGQINSLREQVDQLVAKCASQRKLVGTSHKLTRKRAQRQLNSMKKQLSQMRKQLAKKKVEQGHLCASFSTKEMQTKCLNLDEKKLDSAAKASEGETKVLTMIVNGQVCRMVPRQNVGGEKGSTVYMRVCQPKTTLNKTKYSRKTTTMTATGIVESETKLDRDERANPNYRDPQAKSPVVTNPNGDLEHDAMGVPNRMPNYPRTTKVDVSVEHKAWPRWAKVVLSTTLGALGGGAAGYGIGYAQGEPGELLRTADGLPKTFTPGTQVSKGLVAGGKGLGVGAVIGAIAGFLL